jgi:SAM-dependent methyltransferase
VSIGSHDIAYHEMMGVLGIGDLHPAGHYATEFLLSQIDKVHPRTVLEVGSGAGRTTARMVARGWTVTPIEPSKILVRLLEKNVGIRAHEGTFESFDATRGPFDAVIGEGAFYRLDPAPTIAKLHRLLRPGGLLAIVDMTWTHAARPDTVAFIHDQTKELFGIPMAPREVVTASTWANALRDGGFDEVATKTIPPGEFEADPAATRTRLALGLLKRPDLLPRYLEYRAYRRVRWSPKGWVESWMGVWKRRP